MAVRYNDKSGEFEDVPSLTERIGKFCRSVLRTIFRTVCWLVAVVLVGGGVAAVWKHRAVMGEKFSAMRSCCGAWCGEVWDSCVAVTDGWDLTSVKPLGAWAYANIRYVFIGLAVVLVWKFRKLIWQFIRCPLGIVFYPVVKWWGFVKESWQDGDRFLACIMLFPGLIIIGLYRLAFTAVVSAFGDSLSLSGSWDVLKMVLAIGGLVLFVVFYARALSEAKSGGLVVYRDWADFAKSAVWVIAIPLGIMWMLESRSDFLFRCAGLALAVMGAVSFWLMVSGAFKYNSGSSCWLSLFGRVAVILLLVFALGRLQEKLEQYKRGELGVIRGVLIPLIVFAWMFNFLIRPMIRMERCRW